MIWACRRSRGRGSRARVEDARRVPEEEVIRTNGMGWLRRDHIWLEWQSPWGFQQEPEETWRPNHVSAGRTL